MKVHKYYIIILSPHPPSGLCVALGVGTGELLCMTGDHMTASGIIRGSSGGVDVSRDPDVMLGSTAAGEGAEDMRKGR